MRALLFTLFSLQLLACTDFVVQGQDGSLVNGRTLEFALDLDAKLRIFERGSLVYSKGPEGKSGVEWRSKYGFVGLSVLQFDWAMDGMNEAGLSFGYLWLPGYTKYPAVKEGRDVLDFVDLGVWILGNFRNVEEVKDSLKDIQVWGHPVKGLGETPIHVTVHDANGKSIVIEFTRGQMLVYDNPMSVLTNSPPFPWQIMNVQNFLNLSPNNPEIVSFRGVNLASPGQGGGMMGLPGDWSPPSRFVKIATLLRFVQPVKDNVDALNMTEHLLNSVDIPKGAVLEKQGGSDYTQWVVMKDLKEREFYFRSYGDLNMKKIDLKKINFKRKVINSLPVDLKEGYIDVTYKLSG